MNKKTKLKQALSHFKNRWFMSNGKLVFEKNNEILESRDLLNGRQLQILNLAKKEGYFDIPKIISLTALAVKLSMTASTLCVHIQKIEKSIFNAIKTDFTKGEKDDE